MSVTVDAGGLDPTFGAGGITAIDLAGNLDQAHAMALAPDGKLVIGGTSSFAGPSFNSRAVLVRLNSDGTVDTSFGDNGQLVMPELRLPANPIWPLDVEDFTGWPSRLTEKSSPPGRRSSGGRHGELRITAPPRLQPCEFNTDGTFDQSFGTNGIALADFSTAADTPARLLVAPDGKILVAGSAGTTLSPFDSPSSNYNVFGVARFTADGVLDDTFGGGDGMATVDFTTGAFSGGCGATAITLVGNRIVVAGVASQQNAPKAVALARLNDDGTFDAHFGAGGRVLTIDSCTVSDLMADADGSVLVAESDARGAALVARYTRGGQLDAGFGTDGVATTSVEENLSPNRGYRFTRMADGNVAVAARRRRTLLITPARRKASSSACWMPRDGSSAPWRRRDRPRPAILWRWSFNPTGCCSPQATTSLPAARGSTLPRGGSSPPGSTSATASCRSPTRLIRWIPGRTRTPIRNPNPNPPPSRSRRRT